METRPVKGHFLSKDNLLAGDPQLLIQKKEEQAATTESCPALSVYM
jgi:hypothetical protein